MIRWKAISVLLLSLTLLLTACPDSQSVLDEADQEAFEQELDEAVANLSEEAE